VGTPYRGGPAQSGANRGEPFCLVIQRAVVGSGGRIGDAPVPFGLRRFSAVGGVSEGLCSGHGSRGFRHPEL
jgi:hypothetical protein